ncbi:MAG: hypothetical protein K8R86_09705, partial [Bacteroidales bacterium]|nr:hypothetical protein [Bacteroidales bacterium]
MKTLTFYSFILLFIFTCNLSYSQTYWTGDQNKKWDSYKNWNPQIVPDANTDVIIPGGLSTYPVLNNKELSVNSSVGTYSCRSLLIESGGLLTLSANVDFLIYGDVTVEADGIIYVENLGLFSGGNLYINGGSVQNIKNTPGKGNFYFYSGSGGNMSSGSLYVFNLFYFQSGTGWNADGGTLYLGGDKSMVTIRPTDPDFYVNDLIVLNGVDAEVDPILMSGQQPLQINGDFTVETEASFTIPSQHQVNVTGNFYLKADAINNKASFIDDNNLAVSGETFVEKYYSDNRWHFISSPLSDAVSNVFLD